MINTISNLEFLTTNLSAHPTKPLAPRNICTMMNGTAVADSGPPFKEKSIPSLPKLSSPGWVTPPPILPPGLNDSERLARREANHHVYHCNGNQITWYHYVLFGYYQFDRVEDFLNAWNPVTDTESARYRIMWNTYHHHRMSNIPITPLLNMWANTHAKPYLHEHEPDFLLATEIIYDESRENDTAFSENPEPAWTEIGTKNRRRGKTQSPSPPASPTLSPKESTSITDYYSPIAQDPEDMEMTEDEVQIISPPANPHPIASTPKHSNQSSQDRNPSTPLARIQPISTSTSKLKQQQRLHAIMLRNPYRKKHRSTNPALNQLIRDYIDARKSPPTPTKPTSTTRPAQSSNTNKQKTTTNYPHPSQQKDRQQSPTRHGNPDHLHRSSESIRSPPNSVHTDHSFSNTTYQPPPDPFVLINDGTQRLTIRWRPDSFEALESNSHTWDANLMTALLHLFQEHTSQTALVKWGEQHTPDNNIPLDHVPPDKIREYLSPKISSLPSTKTFIFGIRLCAPDNHLSSWITREATREKLRSNKMEITISNSKSSSGNVVTAGYILMKHPTYTQRYFYLLSLRKALPQNTPFFDLAIHKRTPHGATTPHIAVKCGENHLTGLSEILSAHLDGQKNNTALFVASQAVKSMTQEEINKMFHAHTQFVDSIQRLALYPRVINIDRSRHELRADGNPICRSTREWARSLRTQTGTSMRCDAENGGSDRRAYLLAPTPVIEEAKIELQKYFHGLSAAAATRTQDSSQDTDPLRPTEIYIPTPAVLHNLRFLNSLTSEEVWKCAPPTVRTAIPPTTSPAQQQGYHTTPTTDRAGANKISKSNLVSQSTPQDPTTSDINHQADFPPLHTAHRQDDTTVGTTASNLTRTSTIQQQTHNQSQYNKKFHELDEQIKQHQQEFQSIHARFDTLNEQILRSMTIATDHSRQFSHLEHQMSDMHAALQILLARGDSQQPTTPTNTNTQANARDEETQVIPRNLANELHAGSTQEKNGEGSGSMSIASTSTDSSKSTESAPILSAPEKKRVRQTIQPDDITAVQEESAQYHEESTPADTAV